jgi:hypothetical protein
VVLRTRAEEIRPQAYQRSLESPDRIRKRLGDDCRPTGKNLQSLGFAGENYLEARVEQAALEWALEAEPAAICAIYRDAVERWLPYVEALDWETPVEHFEQVYGAQIRRVAERTGGEVVDDPELGKIVRWHAKPRYGDMAPQLALWAALLSGEADLATRVASVGRLREPSKYQDTFNMVACLVKGDDGAAEAYLQGFRGKYSNDGAYRVQREEIPVGILRADEELIATGLKATTARYRTMWDPKRYKKTVKIGPYWRQPQFDSLEEKLKAVAQDLLIHKWVVSEYALACMVLAVRRGLTASLEQPDLWSEWVPREIVLAATGLG